MVIQITRVGWFGAGVRKHTFFVGDFIFLKAFFIFFSSYLNPESDKVLDSYFVVVVFFQKFNMASTSTYATQIGKYVI